MEYFVISKDSGRMVQYEGESRFKIKDAIHLTQLIREYNGENTIIVNCNTGTQYSYLKIIKGTIQKEKNKETNE